jgi:hypothetical protein
MSMKLILFFSMLCISNHFYAIADNETPAPTVGAIINDVVSMTDDIAEMIIICKTEKDPQKIKALIASIVKSIANIIESIIEKRRLKKLNRSISIDDFDFSDISSQSLEEEVEQILYAVLLKAKAGNN